MAAPINSDPTRNAALCLAYGNMNRTPVEKKKNDRPLSGPVHSTKKCREL